MISRAINAVSRNLKRVLSRVDAPLMLALIA